MLLTLRRIPTLSSERSLSVMQRIAMKSRRFFSLRAAEPVRPSTLSELPFFPMDDRRGVCVVGAGRMGMIRAGGVLSNPGTILTAVVDTDREKSVALAKHLCVPAFRSLQDALGDPRCDAVWVSGPTPSHKETIILAAEAGKACAYAVAVEKPVATTVDDILECHKVCEANGVPLFCSYQRRTDQSFTQLAAAVRAGEVGHVRSVRAVFRDHPTPTLEFLKEGGDIFHDLAPHDIDFVCFSLGLGDPTEVYATATSFQSELEECGVKDTAACMFRFSSGVTFTLEMTRSSAYGYDNRIEVVGDKGMLEVLNPPRNSLKFSSEKGCTGGRPDHSFPERYRQAYISEVGAFEQMIRGLAEPPVTCIQSCHTSVIAEAASQSAATGGPVRISFDGIC
ncbi:unnamed protein product [Choristocarpus tenellus]